MGQKTPKSLAAVSGISSGLALSAFYFGNFVILWVMHIFVPPLPCLRAVSVGLNFKNDRFLGPEQFQYTFTNNDHNPHKALN